MEHPYNGETMGVPPVREEPKLQAHLAMLIFQQVTKVQHIHMMKVMPLVETISITQPNGVPLMAIHHLQVARVIGYLFVEIEVLV